MTFEGRAPTAVLSAMPEELQVLLEALEGRQTRTRGRIELHEGNIEGVPAILAVSGVGKVNAAAVTQTLVLEGASALIFTGVAGSARDDLSVGDIVISRDALQHDVDVSPLGYEPGLVPGQPLVWEADFALVKLAREAADAIASGESGTSSSWAGGRPPTVIEGRVGTGDRFLADAGEVSRLRREFAIDCVEMEGAAAAQVCHGAGVPFVIIRSMSDSANEEARMSFREFTDLAAGRAKLLVRTMLANLGPKGL